MRHPLTPDESEDRSTYPCLASTTRTEGDHVYRTLPDGSEVEILPAPEWDDTPFDDRELPDASGDYFERLAEALHQANFHTVRAFLRAYQRHDGRLDRLVYPGDANLMRVMPERIAEFVEHLEERRAEWERWRDSQCGE